ncbi:hypothetical protein BX666DRAFT_1976016 [Dichotomocladium elegans]|nr:hypothetical protein BX666DRAFT_1976016 [Dichotomocladium elegans]
MGKPICFTSSFLFPLSLPSFACLTRTHGPTTTQYVWGLLIPIASHHQHAHTCALLVSLDCHRRYAVLHRQLHHRSVLVIMGR